MEHTRFSGFVNRRRIFQMCMNTWTHQKTVQCSRCPYLLTCKCCTGKSTPNKLLATSGPPCHKIWRHHCFSVISGSGMMGITRSVVTVAVVCVQLSYYSAEKRLAMFRDISVLWQTGYDSRRWPRLLFEAKTKLKCHHAAAVLESESHLYKFLTCHVYNNKYRAFRGRSHIL